MTVMSWFRALAGVWNGQSVSPWGGLKCPSRTEDGPRSGEGRRIDAEQTERVARASGYVVDVWRSWVGRVGPKKSMSSCVTRSDSS
jgi:hypothetical protein